MSFWGIRKGLKLRQSDKLFSRLERTKRGYKCECCGKIHDTSSLNCGLSHFWPRANETTRYDPLNVHVFCNLPCHQYFEVNRKKYEKWTEERMGIKEYNLLMFRAHQSGKWDTFIEKELCKQFREELKNL